MRRIFIATLALLAGCPAKVTLGDVPCTNNTNCPDNAFCEVATGRCAPVDPARPATAKLALQAGSSGDFGTVGIGGNKELTLTLVNSGSAAATGIAAVKLDAPFTYKEDAYPGTGGTCGKTLAGSGGSCKLVLVFVPSTEGNANETLKLNYNDGKSNQAFEQALTGAGALPAALSFSADKLSADALDFGIVAIGGSASVDVSVANTGALPATQIAAASLGGDFAFEGGTYPGTGANGCSATIAAAASCKLHLVFKPSVAGAAATALLLSFSDGAVSSQSAMLRLTGAGGKPALLTFHQSALDFEVVRVGASTAKIFNVDYSGEVAATGVSLSRLVSPFARTGGSCGATISRGGCTLEITFTPTAQALVGPIGLSLSYNNGVSTLSTPSASLSGRGVIPATLSWADAADHNFGPQIVGVTTPLSLDVNYDGGVAATALSASLSNLEGPDGGFAVDAGSCVGPLSRGCTVGANFLPQNSGATSAQFNLAYNDGVGTQTLSKKLSGTGQLPAVLSFQEGARFSFAPVLLGQSATKTFHVLAVGDVAATSVTANTGSGPFAVTKNDCGTSIAAPGGCPITVTFTPAVVGTATGVFGLSYNNGLRATDVGVTLTGTGTSSTTSLVWTNTANYGSATAGSTLVIPAGSCSTQGQTSTVTVASGLNGVQVQYAVRGVASPSCAVYSTSSTSFVKECGIQPAATYPVGTYITFACFTPALTPINLPFPGEDFGSAGAPNPTEYQVCNRNFTFILGTYTCK